MPGQRSRLASIHTAYALLRHITSSVEGSTCEDVVANLVQLMKQSSAFMQLVIPLAMLVMALSRYTWITQPCLAVRNYIWSFFTARVTITATHPLQKLVMAWMIHHGLGDRARTLALSPPQEVKSHTKAYRDFDIHYGLRPGMRRRTEEVDDRKRDELIYVPDVGQYSFTFQGYRMSFDKQTTKKEECDRETFNRYTKDDDTIVISCFALPWSGTKPIQAFLDHVKAQAELGEETMTKIFRPGGAMREGNFWDDGMARPSRKLAAVTLDDHIKIPLVKDIEDYLDPRTKRFYLDNGIPYRKGYLLYGPPGTGKTSFATALAGEYGLNVYLLSLSDSHMTDRRLEELFEMLPTKCIVLLEDVDSAGIKREDMRLPPPPKSKRKRKSNVPPPVVDLIVENSDSESDNPFVIPPFPIFPQGVTLSGLLNVLDGIHAAEGRIVLMTSNNPNSLDKALIRQGRIDRKVLFGYASHEVATKLFLRIFQKTPDQLLDDEKGFDNVEELAARFADHIPPGEITPAAIQGHLLQYRTDPAMAVETTAEFVRQTIEEKKKGLNVSGFDEGFSDDGDDESDSSSEGQSEMEDMTTARSKSRGRGRGRKREKGEKRAASRSVDASSDAGRHAQTVRTVRAGQNPTRSTSNSSSTSASGVMHRAALSSRPSSRVTNSRPNTPASSIDGVDQGIGPRHAKAHDLSHNDDGNGTFMDEF